MEKQQQITNLENSTDEITRQLIEIRAELAALKLEIIESFKEES